MIAIFNTRYIYKVDIAVEMGMFNALSSLLPSTVIVDIVVDNAHYGWIMQWIMQYLTRNCGYCRG